MKGTQTAVRVGFEPTVGKFPTEVFKTSALDRYATSPCTLDFCAEDEGVEPTERLRVQGLANLCPADRRILQLNLPNYIKLMYNIPKCPKLALQKKN